MSNNKTEVEKAMAVIKQAMIDDNPSEQGSYAHGWHCNIAMACYDAILADNERRQKMFQVSYSAAHKIGNDAASRFMKICFDVDTKG